MRELDAPRDVQAEKAVLGAALVSRNALNLVISELEVPDFYSEEHREVFAAIKEAGRDNEHLDHLLVAQYLPKHLQIQGREFLFSLAESLPTASNADKYVQIIRACSCARQALDALDRTRNKLSQSVTDEYEGVVQGGMKELENVLRRSDSRGGGRQIGDWIQEVSDWLDEAGSSGGVTGIRTGITKFDRVLSGLNKERLYVLAGRPSSGKSQLCAQIGLVAARQGYRVLLVSLEMSGRDYLQRLALASAGVEAEDQEEGGFTEEQKDEVKLEMLRIRDLPFRIVDDSKQTTDDIRRECMRYEPDLLIVDYLQRIKPLDSSRSKYEQVSEVSFEIDRMKKDFQIPVLAAAQLNRAVDQRSNPKPEVSDLRDSGTIEQDADVIAMLHRPGHYDADEPDNLMVLRTRKNRHGTLAECKLFADKAMWITDRPVGQGPVYYED